MITDSGGVGVFTRRYNSSLWESGRLNGEVRQNIVSSISASGLLLIDQSVFGSESNPVIPATWNCGWVGGVVWMVADILLRRMPSLSFLNTVKRSEFAGFFPGVAPLLMGVVVVDVLSRSGVDGFVLALVEAPDVYRSVAGEMALSAAVVAAGWMVRGIGA